MISHVQTDGIFNKDVLEFLRENDVLVLGGPTEEIWAEKLELICNYSDTLCAAVHGFDPYPNTPVKVLDHWGQNVDADRFQVYIEDYFNAESKHSHLIDFGMIKNPVSMWVGLWDGVCPPQYTQYIRSQLGDNLNHYLTLPWHGHGTFAIANMWSFCGDVAKYLDYPENMEQEVAFLQA